MRKTIKITFDDTYTNRHRLYRVPMWYFFHDESNIKDEIKEVLEISFETMFEAVKYLYKDKIPNDAFVSQVSRNLCYRSFDVLLVSSEFKECKEFDLIEAEPLPERI